MNGLILGGDWDDTGIQLGSVERDQNDADEQSVAEVTAETGTA